MKKMFWALLLMAFSGNVQAKYNAPEGVITRSMYIADWQVRELDTDGDGKLSLEEFKRKVENYSRDDRRNVRQAKKEGRYMTPEEQFTVMDKDKDGLVTEDEMADFVRAQRDEYGVYY